MFEQSSLKTWKLKQNVLFISWLFSQWIWERVRRIWIFMPGSFGFSFTKVSTCVYVQKSNLFHALSPDPSKYPIYSDFHHTNHALILWAGLTSRVRVRVGARSRADEMLVAARPQPRPAAPTLSLYLKSPLLNSSCAAPDPPAKITWRISAKINLNISMLTIRLMLFSWGLVMSCIVLPSQGLQ